MYCWLRARQFKDDTFECFNFLCEGCYDAGILSILCCLSGMLFIIEVNEVSLHS